MRPIGLNTARNGLCPPGRRPWWRRAVGLYADGFRSMRTGRKLWALIIIKLLVLFGVLKLFFFPDVLKRDYTSDADRAAAVRTHLTEPTNTVTYE